MKNLLLILLLLPFAFQLNAQTQCEKLQTENETLKTKNLELNNRVLILKTENDSLKKALKMNTPIKMSEKNNINVKVTKIVGNKSNNTISISLLIENTAENKQLSFRGFSIIDLEGNEYFTRYPGKVEGLVSDKYALFTREVPKKIIPIFAKVESHPLFIKLLRFDNLLGPTFEFRDLKVDWK